MRSLLSLSLLLFLVAACGGGLGSVCVRNAGCDDPRSCVQYNGACGQKGSSFVAGAACDSNSDCGDGLCGTWPGGSCFKSCSTKSDCGSGGTCIRYSDGETQCHEECVPGSNTCRSGYSCQATTNGGGFCVPAETKDPIGASCSSNSECATNVCAAWPGGYCSKGCNNSTECGAGNTCVTDAINGVDACLVKCSAPGRQSTCRAGYTCIELVGQTYGACVAVEEQGGGTGGGSGGSGGGTGGGSGAGGGSGGGGMPAGPCRTFASSFTETITPPAGATTSTTYSASFDRTTRKLTRTWPGVTVVETYASVADFIDLASPSVFLKPGGPTSVRVTASNYLAETIFTYDAQRRLLGSVTTVTVGSTSYEASRATYTMWDSYGRVMSGKQDLKSAAASEKCMGQNLGFTYDVSTRSRVSYWSGGVSSSSDSTTNNCTPGNITEYFDTRLILTKSVLSVHAKYTYGQYATHATATVCQ